MSRYDLCTHDMVIGWRVVKADFTSGHQYGGFQWPFPGGWAEAAGPFTTGGDGCPRKRGDGICVALTPEGAASGGTPMHTVLVVGYYAADVLAAADEKVRVKRALVLDVWDAHRLIRDHGARASLDGARLVGASLDGASLDGASLDGARLDGARLDRASLDGARLVGARLDRATYDKWTRFPAGFDPRAAGMVEVKR